MKTAIRGKTSPQTNFEDEYRSSLREYAAGGGELALGRAYELGRRARNEQKSLIEMASLPHHAVLALIRDAESDKQRGESIRAGSEFLAECLSPYEMAHRGFQDAVKALRQLNETLEEEIKRIAYAVHDEAGQLLVAVHLALAEMALELPEAQQGQVTRIGELLNEVEKHLRLYSHEVRPTIRDDGVRFDPHQVQTASHRNGLGLVAMQERVSAIGGTLQIESRPGHGTELSIRLPLEDSHANSNRTRR